MKKISLICFLFLVVACTHNRYKPDIERVISTENCTHLSGLYAMDFDDFAHYNSLGFWELTNYEQIDVRVSGSDVLFSGLKSGEVQASLTVPKEKWTCQNGVLSVDAEDLFENNGGVSVYSARSIEMYSYKPEEAILRFREQSTGLVFLVPASLGGDSKITLSLMSNTPK